MNDKMSTERSRLLDSSEERKVGKHHLLDKTTDAERQIGGPKRVSLCFSYRMGVVLCCTIAMTTTFAIQASMSSAMVCMLENQDDDDDNDPDDSSGMFQNTSLPKANRTNQDWKFDWSKDEQGWVLSSFFIGYYISQLPSGIAAARFGPKRVVVTGLILTSILQCLAVPAARYSIIALYFNRFFVGLIDGFLYAPTFALVGQWAPRHEISLLFGIVGMGMELGNMFSFAVSTFSCEIDFQGGWPLVFYILSAIGLVIALLFLLFVSDSPFDNKKINKKELRYIAGTVPKLESKKDGDKILAQIPVKQILKSMPVWAIVVSQIASDWMYYLLITVSPTYLKEVIKLDELEINLLSGLPFIGIIPAIYIAGFISDRLVVSGRCTNTTVRKINDAFSKLVPCGVIIGLAFVPEGSVALAFTLNLIGATFLGFSYVSWMANPVDLAPAYTGFIVGVCEVGAMWVAIVVPIMFEQMTKSKSRDEWQTAFFITAGLQLICLIFYCIFASGELQPWALSSYKYKYSDLDKDSKKSLTDEYKDGSLYLSPGSSSTDSILKEKRKITDSKSSLIHSLTHSLGGSLEFSGREKVNNIFYSFPGMPKNSKLKADLSVSTHSSTSIENIQSVDRTVVAAVLSGNSKSEGALDKRNYLISSDSSGKSPKVKRQKVATVKHGKGDVNPFASFGSDDSQNSVKETSIHASDMLVAAEIEVAQKQSDLKRSLSSSRSLKQEDETPESPSKKELQDLETSGGSHLSLSSREANQGYLNETNKRPSILSKVFQSFSRSKSSPSVNLDSSFNSLSSSSGTWVTKSIDRQKRKRQRKYHRLQSGKIEKRQPDNDVDENVLFKKP